MSDLSNNTELFGQHVRSKLHPTDEIADESSDDSDSDTEVGVDDLNEESYVSGNEEEFPDDHIIHNSPRNGRKSKAIKKTVVEAPNKPTEKSSTLVRKRRRKH
ncbi:hypothetical protein AKO1_002107 [Acrasis kona]|uniref:Uncharacterized protein n=1 Tax=Acrasis kona TaxID=1008807 RepID=A0AAW2YNG8_9EUKA